MTVTASCSAKQEMVGHCVVEERAWSKGLTMVNMESSQRHETGAGGFSFCHGGGPVRSEIVRVRLGNSEDWSDCSGWVTEDPDFLSCVMNRCFTRKLPPLPLFRHRPHTLHLFHLFDAALSFGISLCLYSAFTERRLCR
jgi:hypothetical protein